MGQRSAARTWGLGSRGICYLGITAITWGLVVQLEVGAWRYSYTEQKDYTWEQARNYCQTYFTDLVAIQNKREIEHLNQWLPFHRRYYWIGIRKLNGTWTWVGTRKALTKEAENWAEKEPNNKRSNQDCVEIYIKRQQEPGKWNDEPCSKMKRALCYQASCQPFPCSQRGECVETIGNYSCECQPGFYGRDCENVIVCPELNAPNWGELSCSHLHGNFTFGSTCAFSCQTGFVLTGPQSRECTAVGEWTGQSPRCEAIQCPALAAPAMGHAACSHLHGNFTFGSTCAFSCQTGFVLTGPQSRECTAVGEWTGQSPRCEAIQCPALAAPAMGHAACSHLHGNFTFGSTCAFSCQTGFVLTGPQSRECTAVGEWTGQSPQCEAIQCPALAAPAMGHAACSHLHGNFTFGSTCAFSCQTGFVLTGPQSRECTAVGEWTGQSPRCEAIQCPALAAPAMGHAACSHLHGNFTFGSTCAFSCQTGFVLTGPQSRECTAVGEWTGQSPRCEAIQCPALAAPAMGHAACSHLHGNFTFGSTCAFSCQTGFVLTGPQSRECTAVGEWTGQSPRCEAVVCPVLSAPNWGELSCSHLHGNFTFGSTCAFSCQTGFVLMGPQSRECTAVGEWTGQSPRCEAVSCPVLDAPSRGQLSCSHLHGNFTYSSTCAFSCEAGFVRMGAEVLRCAATGNWTRRPPVCAEDATSFLKEVLVYSGSTALVAVGIVLSGTLIALLVKRLSDREEKKKLLNPTSDLGSPGIFTNAAYDSNL
ncbi:P-selectin-like isoform X3 [Struthio camelus]